MYSLKDFGVTKEVGLLENGARVVLFKRLGMPIATNIAFVAGSRYDPKGKEGLAHFTEHMILQKTKMFDNVSNLSKFIEEIGGYLNAFTDSQIISLVVDISDKADYHKVVTLVNEVVNNVVLDTKVFENERNVILKEIKDYKSNPQSNVFDIANDLLFQGTEVGRSIAGDDKTMHAITQQDILDFYNKKITTNNMTIIVSGDIELKELLSLYNEGLAFQNSPETSRINNNELKIFKDKQTKIEVYKDTDNVPLVIGFRTSSMFDNDAVPLTVLATICGSGFTSSLYKKLREDKGLVYGVHAESFGIADGGAWTVSTSTPKEHVQEVLDIICDEFKRIESGAVLDSELVLAKDKIIKSRRQAMQTSRSWVNFHTEDETLNPSKAMDLDKVLEKIHKTTLNDLDRIGKKYFKKGSVYLAMCGNVSDDEFKINY